MKHTKKLLIGLVTMATIQLSAQVTTPAGRKLRQYELKNGLTVILDENHDKPEVFGLITVKAGGKHDPADATGMAHYQEHMLFKGTTTLGTIDWEKEKPHIDKIFELYDQLGKTTDEKQRKEIQSLINEESLKAGEYAIPNELSNLLNEMGGTNVNAATGVDFTVYFNKFPSNQILKWLDLYAHRFEQPVFRGFQAELEVVYEEKNLYNDKFQTKLIEEFQKQFFKNHPYGQQTLIGTIDDLKNPSLSKMYDFFKAYYLPNNMALILAGDFDSEKIMPVIEEKFGKWQRGELPKERTWSEEPFKGREFFEAKLTPIKLGVLGFRAPSQKDKEFVKASMMAQLLNNSYSTGLLDNIADEGKVLVAQVLQFPYTDHGIIGIFYVPKIIGQSLKDAEDIIMAEIDKLKKGEFDNQTLDNIKRGEYISFVNQMEQNMNRAMKYSQNFIIGQPAKDVYDYTEILKSITKEEIVELANRIFGDNYLSYHSKMGFPKKEKIEKPEYKPLLANTNARSEYAKHFDTLPVLEPVFKTIDFDKDIERQTLSKHIELAKVKNPDNDIYTLQIEYKVGTAEIPHLYFASQAVKYFGTGDMSLKQIKNEFAKLGTTFSVWSTRTSTYIKITGQDDNFDAAVELFGKILTAPTLAQSNVKTIIDGEFASRKLERSEADAVADALLNYGLKGEQSKYINRLSTKKIKKISASELVDAMVKATKYSAQINYTGSKDIGHVAKVIKNSIPFAENPSIDKHEIDLPNLKYTENTILFVNKSKARQSKMFVYIEGEPFEPHKASTIEAFNEYFGGGFNGLLMQEIREYRSLAYAVGGRFSPPAVKGKPYNFYGYVGTQADKTLNAMEVYASLINDMPQKPERTTMIKNYLELSAQTKRPGFRDLAEVVSNWKQLGYTTDPINIKLPDYKKIDWNTINDFYSSEMKGKPVVYFIVGDKKHIDMKELAKYGKVVEVKEKALYTK